MRVLLGVTGSVAAVKAPQLASRLVDEGHEVQVVVTNTAEKFISGWSSGYLVRRDSDEWSGEYKLHQSRVLHIELREWADFILIAPLSANTLGKLANGLADNLLTCIMRAWQIEKEVFVAPAMNTEMWNHPVTREHLTKLGTWYQYFRVIQPIKKMLACGTVGLGAMAEIDSIIETLNSPLGGQGGK